ncbi:MAG TPA: CBS domain-containing protein [Chloroflexota bacterium]
MTLTVARLLSSKGHDLWSIAPDATVYDAIALMAEHGIGALLVMDGEQLLGIVTERDYARKVILQDRSSRDTPVSTIMSKDIQTVRPDHSIEACMALMTEKRIRHLPVVQDGHVIGILSIGDLVKFIIADRETLIEQLEGYITGR